jgi:mercuric ion transport protein
MCKAQVFMNKRSQTLQRTESALDGQTSLQKLAVAGGLLGALAASSCCILPLVLFAIGAGGAWIGSLTALAPYQPVFIIVTLGFLGYGFWTAYHRPTCSEGGSCSRPISDRLFKIGLWISTIIVAAAIAFPFAAPSVLGN